MPPKKGISNAGTASKSIRASDSLGRSHTASSRQQKPVQTDEATDKLPVLPAWMDNDVPVPFRPPRMSSLHYSSCCVATMLCMLVHYSMHGATVRMYPWDLIAYQVWLLADTGISRKVETVFQEFIAPGKTRKFTVQFSTASIVELVVMALLSIRLSFRYTIVIVLLPFMLEFTMSNYWRVKLHVMQAKPRVVAQWLPYQLLALAGCRAVVVGVVVAALPALAAMTMPIIILDGIPLLITFIVTVMLSLCMETTALIVCLQSTMIKSLNIGDGSSTDVNFRAVIAVVANTAFWELDRQNTDVSSVPAWSSAAHVMYAHGDSVTRAGRSGALSVYHAVGSCWPGLDPVGFYSQSLRLTFDDPFRAVTYALIPLVVAVLLMAEAVVFLRRWELYLAELVILFVGVVASFAFGYAAMITLRRAALQDAGQTPAALSGQN